MPDQNNSLSDIQQLHALRIELEDYLRGLARGAAKINAWLDQHKPEIILGSQKLMQQLRAKQITAATDTLAKLQSQGVAGFILASPDMQALLSELGQDNPFSQAVAGIPIGLPQNFQEPLLSISDTGREVLARVMQEAPTAQEEGKEDPAWYNPAGWFKKEERQKKKEAQSMRAKEALAALEVQDLFSDKHYYIDSYMDWLADSFVPEHFDENGKPVNTDKKQLLYTDPAYAIRLALEDYRTATEGKMKNLRKLAARYSDLVGALEGEDGTAALAHVTETLYPKRKTEDAFFLKKILLEDRQCSSVFDLAKQAKTIQICSTLTIFFLEQGENIVLKNATLLQRQEAYLNYLDMAVNKDLHPLVLAFVIQHLSLNPDERIPLPNRGRNALQYITECVEDFQKRKELMGTVLSVSPKSAVSPDLLATYLRLCDALKHKNKDDAASALDGLRGAAAGIASGLWKLCYPDTSFLEKLLQVDNDPKSKAALLDKAFEAGLLHELSAGEKGSAVSFAKLMQAHILPNLNSFPKETAGKLILHANTYISKPDMTRLLSQHKGWIQTVIASSKIDTAQKVEWLSALLADFPSDVARANILYDASISAESPAKEFLQALEQVFVPKDVRLSDTHILCNLKNVAYIWYNAANKALMYAHAFGSHDAVLENISQETANDAIKLILRRHPSFMKERNGLAQPSLLDKICFKKGGQEIEAHWNGLHAALHLSPRDVSHLLKSEDFICLTDEETGETVLFNRNSICLLQKTTEGVVAVDKHGNIHQGLAGDLSSQEMAPLLPVSSSTWFNPAHASIVHIDAAQQALEFRMESRYFKMHMLSEDKVLYTVKAQSQELAHLRKIIQADGDMFIPNGDFYLNVKRLGYMAVQDADKTSNEGPGFYCQCKGYKNLHHFMRTEKSTLRDIRLHTLGNQNILKLSGLLVHAENIDIITIEPKRISLVVGDETVQVPAGAATWRKSIIQFFENKGFISCKTKHETTLIHPDRATLFARKGLEKTKVVTTIPLLIPSDPGFVDDISKQNAGRCIKELDPLVRQQISLFWELSSKKAGDGQPQRNASPDKPRRPPAKPSGSPI